MFVPLLPHTPRNAFVVPLVCAVQLAPFQTDHSAIAHRPHVARAGAPHGAEGAPRGAAGLRRPCGSVPLENRAVVADRPDVRGVRHPDRAEVFRGAGALRDPPADCVVVRAVDRRAAEREVHQQRRVRRGVAAQREAERRVRGRSTLFVVFTTSM